MRIPERFRTLVRHLRGFLPRSIPSVPIVPPVPSFALPHFVVQMPSAAQPASKDEDAPPAPLKSEPAATAEPDPADPAVVFKLAEPWMVTQNWTIDEHERGLDFDADGLIVYHPTLKPNRGPYRRPTSLAL